MREVLTQIDLLIRGEFTGTDELRQARIRIPGPPLAFGALLLGAFYGLCMALYGAVHSPSYGPVHVLAVMIKVPLLFLLTLLITCPSLYVFSALARSRLSFRPTLRLLLAATTVSLTVLASLGPITAFFTFSTRSHPFMQLLNFALFGAAGLAGLSFLYTALAPVLEPGDEGRPRPGTSSEPAHVERRDAPSGPDPVAGDDAQVAVTRSGARMVKRMFVAWLVIYGFVGAQMGWILRPFIGSPQLEAEVFRPVESNIFEGLLEALRYL